MMEKIRGPLYAAGLLAGTIGGYAFYEAKIEEPVHTTVGESHEDGNWTDEAWALYFGFVGGFTVSSVVGLSVQAYGRRQQQATIDQQTELEKL